MAIILPPGVKSIQQPLNKQVTLKTRSGAQLSMPFVLQDENGRDSAAEYLEELHNAIRSKLNEPVLEQLPRIGGPDLDSLKKQIIYIASFHDAMFGTFNRDSTLPAQERADFIELFLLAIASVIPQHNILVDLTTGNVGEAGN